MKNAGDWIGQLELVPHPEGGYYRQTYCSGMRLGRDVLAREFDGPRPLSTCIYFLLEGRQVSFWHRIRSDEIWHWYAGSALILYVIEKSGRFSEIKMGTSAAGERPQAVIGAGNWMAAEVEDKGAYSLIGCTVAPGFDFADFELADAGKLAALYPQHCDGIQKIEKMRMGLGEIRSK